MEKKLHRLVLVEEIEVEGCLDLDRTLTVSPGKYAAVRVTRGRAQHSQQKFTTTLSYYDLEEVENA